MTTITLKINEKTKAGKAFLAMSETFLKGVKGIEIVKNENIEDEETYNPAFVEIILDAHRKGKFTKIDPKNVWESIGLK